MSSYCASRFRTIRRAAREVMIGPVGIGGTHPIRVQSMTTSDTQDIAATVRQSIALAEVGCEIIRVTAPNVAAARCLRDIRRELSVAGFGSIPLVADIHFLPSAALEAVEHVEKVRVNPGNYADKKKFAVREYSDAAYAEELARLHETFSPLVLRCKTLGRAMRIGTNHGSLSDRIMNRYGDTALGMVESALEFLRIAESHAYHDIVLSMKASNPKIMIQAYRLLVTRMAEENMHYPLHLGVTEAGDGQDGRIKSAIGIGSLLLDGLGDTIRVSLTEDSVYEIPVAQALARRAMSRWRLAPVPSLSSPLLPLPAPLAPLSSPAESLDPFRYARRGITPCDLGPAAAIASDQPTRVIIPAPLTAALNSPRLADTPAEALLLSITTPTDLPSPNSPLPSPPPALVLSLAPALTPSDLTPLLAAATAPVVLLRRFTPADAARPADFAAWTALLAHPHARLALATTAEAIAAASTLPAARLFITLDDSSLTGPDHAIGAYRALAAALAARQLPAPLWIRNTSATALAPQTDFLGRLLDAAILTGSLLADGLGDLLSIETEPDPLRVTQLTYNILQGAGSRITRTEFVACPSCGRTLFDLQTTTQRIRAQTGHLKGVKIAIMGCIVNGPGEMADADFGYVGGAPGKINLYVGKTCVQYNIPQNEADARLISLIREHGKWTDPRPAAAPPVPAASAV